MKDLFNADGHLTDYAIERLLAADLPELPALEVAEHLAFCDACLNRYTEALEKVPLLAPPEPLAEKVLKKVRRRSEQAFFNKYASMAMAACFALIFWLGGVFTISIPAEAPEWLANVVKHTNTIGSVTVDFSNSIGQSITEIFDHFDLKGAFEHEKE